MVAAEPVAGGAAVGWNPAASSHESGSRLLSLVLNTLLRWWKLVIPVGVVLAAGVAAFLIWRFEPEYKSYALVEIQDVTPFLAFPSNSGRSGQQYIETQIELLRSSVVLEPVLARDEIRRLEELEAVEDKEGYLASRLEIRQVGGSELYGVIFTGKDKAGAADVVNAVIAEYFQAQRLDEFERTQRVIELLNEEESKRKLDVERMRENVKALNEELTGTDPYTQQVTASGTFTNSLADLRTTLAETEALQAELKAKIRAYDGAGDPRIPSSQESWMLSMEVNSLPEVTSLKREIELLRSAVDQRRDYGSDVRGLRGRGVASNSTEARLQMELDHREKTLEVLKKQLRREVAQKKALEEHQQRASAISELQQQLTAAEERHRILQAQYEKEREKRVSGGATSVELEFAREELSHEERVFDMIASRKISLQTEQRAPARVRLRHEPSVASRPVESLPIRPLFAGGVIALAIPFALAVAWEGMVRRVANADQLREGSHLPVLAEVARYPSVAYGPQPQRLSRRAQAYLGIVEECIDGLRTTLALTENLKATGVLAVTSSTKGEGKTTIAIQLAHSIARSQGKATLLIDGDTRSPDVHRTLDLPLAPGFTEVLAGKCKLADAIHQIEASQLFVLPAGEMSGSPHDHIRSERVEKLLDDLRQSYPHVVIDTPPVLNASESMIYARYADSVLFCCMRDVSRVGQVHVAVERLARARANLCGAVLSGTPLKSYVYRYGSYPYSS